MYKPSLHAPASRLLAVGDYLVASLRHSPVAPELVAVVQSAMNGLTQATSASHTALRRVTPYRVALRFAEQRVLAHTRALALEALALGIQVPASDEAPIVETAGELLGRVGAHLRGHAIRARYEELLRDAIQDLDTQIEAYETALRAHDEAVLRETGPRERFLRAYDAVVTAVCQRISDPTLQEAFFDDPCVRRALRPRVDDIAASEGDEAAPEPSGERLVA